MATSLELGVALNDDFLVPDRQVRQTLINRMVAAGLDHLTVGDHISFHGGTGFDGFVAATAALSGHESLQVQMGVYLAALRHPLATARQLSTLTQLAPGRLTFGVGVAGEDRSEVANMGVDPTTRGRRLDETLHALRRLASGEVVDHEGEFYQFEGAQVLPAPSPAVPIVIGGGGDVAVRRTAEHGDGWLAMWCSSRRYTATQAEVVAACADAGRPTPTFAGLNVWVGLGADAGAARARLGARMQDLYRLPPEKFQHLAPAGTSRDVAEFLQPYVAGGARTITLIPVSGSAEEAVELSGEVKQHLLDELAVPT